MSGSPYAKGRRSEYRVQAILEAAGYQTMRAAGSKGAIDICAWNQTSVRFIQVKAGSRGCSPVEREAMQLLVKPPNASVEIWRFRNRQAPEIEVIG